MQLIDLLKREAAGTRRDLAIAIVVSAAANAAILAIVNQAVRTVSFESLNSRHLVMFLLAIAIYIVGLKFTFDRATMIFERMLNRVRTRLARKLAAAELPAVEDIGKAEIYKRITQETTVISESQGLLTAALHSLVMVTFTSIYIATLSLAAFVTILVLILGGIYIYRRNEEVIRENIIRTGKQEIAFFHGTTDLIDGLKELKMNRRKAAGLVADLRQISNRLETLKIRTTTLYNNNAIFSQCFFYILIGAIVFVLPRLIPVSPTTASQLIAAILFIFGPLSTVVTGLPALSKANMAAEALGNLEKQLDESAASGSAAELKTDVRPLRFQRQIELRDAAFQYRDESQFSVGPLSLEIAKGEVVFIIGGNGSGKTTLMKLLTGLYKPTSGGLRIDDKPVSWSAIQQWRELFSIIFSDFHLFEKFYGSKDVDAEQVRSLLSSMRLTDKTDFEDGRFTTLELSTGQRKRLAMVVALTEDRPIMVFDEWAADQDPEFRKYFYEVLLANLKNRGKTVIAVTHDDHYFQYCDKLVKMDLGAIEFVRANSRHDRTTTDLEIGATPPRGEI
jgi:cyclic peptide transporter